jgi:hypothetical protein
MSTLFRRIGKALSSQIIAILALCIAVSGGTAYAVAGHNSVVSSSIKNGQVKTPDLARNAVKQAKIAKNAVTGAKVANGSLTGADVNESTLGTVPSAATAQVGGTAWMSPRGTCTPPSTSAFSKCTELSFTMPHAGQLVLIGQVGIQHRNDNQYEATGYCRFDVNGTAGVTSYIARDAGTLSNGWPQLTPMLDTAQVAAGPVTVGIWCEDSYYSKFSDVAFVAQATMPGQ